MILRILQGVILAGAFFICLSAAAADDISSIQLVGNFNGVTCEPDDPANNMVEIEESHWCKLKFINEPGDPDTVFFKFTKNGSYIPDHWGWSGVWGVAEFGWWPPSIGTVLPDSGYYYFHFNDTSYAYWIDRPTGSIYGGIESDMDSIAPAGTIVTLFDSYYNLIGSYSEFTDSTYSFLDLPPSIYKLFASAPGYNDTTIADIELLEGESKWILIHLINSTAVMISASSCEHVDGGILLTWATTCCRAETGFDIFRGPSPYLENMEKRNDDPIYPFSAGFYRFMDGCEDPGADLYYYIVEVGDDNPTRHGPLLVKGIIPEIENTLGQNYPNPFNPATTIPYTVGPEGKDDPVRLSFYDVAGRLIDKHDLGVKKVGNHTFRWNPSLSSKGVIPSGVYYCRLQIGKETFTEKLVLLR